MNVIKKRKWFGRKRLWHNLRYLLGLLHVKARQTSVSMVSVVAEIGAARLTNRNQKRYRSSLCGVCVCVCVCFTLDAGLLARSQYPEGPATGHLDTGFSWFPCA